MAVIQFTRPEVAAKYVATVEDDIRLHTGCYTGNLSGINICGADHLYETKHPAIKLKEAAPAASTANAEEV